MKQEWEAVYTCLGRSELSRVSLDTHTSKLLQECWAQGDKIEMLQRHLRWYAWFAWGFLAISVGLLIALGVVVFL